ncbi:MAG: metallophosphoesterase family protein [Novipirellula sp. JB048]
MHPPNLPYRRRAFLQNGSLVLAAASLGASGMIAPQASADESGDELRVGMITDLHYADKPPGGSRHYRKTLRKLEEAGRQFERDQPAFVVELGDLIDAADSVATERRYLKTIDRQFRQLGEQRHYVLGNHCVDTLTKEEFLGDVGQAKSYYSFDRGGYHFVVLDSCFRSDGQPYQRKNFTWTDANIPPAELEWLAADLKATDKHVIVFAHQRLDLDNHYAVQNSAAVRQTLAAAGNVLAVFQGHSHRNDLNQIDGIHYCTLVAMVEGAANNGYATMSLSPAGTIRVTGYRDQQSRSFASPS